MSVYPFLRYDDAPAAIDFLQRAFGFETKLVVPGANGKIDHAQLTLAGGIVMLASACPDPVLRIGSPQKRGSISSGIFITIDDPDAHHAHAKAAGAEIIMPLTDQDYGSREYAARDPEGYLWSFGTYRP